jgi:hypothetical protein
VTIGAERDASDQAGDWCHCSKSGEINVEIASHTAADGPPAVLVPAQDSPYCARAGSGDGPNGRLSPRCRPMWAPSAQPAARTAGLSPEWREWRGSYLWLTSTSKPRGLDRRTSAHDLVLAAYATDHLIIDVRSSAGRLLGERAVGVIEAVRASPALRGCNRGPGRLCRSLRRPALMEQAIRSVPLCQGDDYGSGAGVGIVRTYRQITGAARMTGRIFSMASPTTLGEFKNGIRPVTPIPTGPRQNLHSAALPTFPASASSGAANFEDSSFASPADGQIARPLDELDPSLTD